jgi:hypothetical protein
VDSRRMRRRRRSVASESAGSVLGLGSDSSEEGLGRKWLTSGGRFFTKSTAGLASVVRSTSVGLRHAITRVAREERLHWIRWPILWPLVVPHHRRISCTCTVSNTADSLASCIRFPSTVPDRLPETGAAAKSQSCLFPLDL